MECALLNDKRRITQLLWTEDWRTVGRDGVTSITVIPVAGNGGYIPWFEVTLHNGTIARYNSTHLSGVVYETPEGAQLKPARE